MIAESKGKSLKLKRLEFTKGIGSKSIVIQKKLSQSAREIKVFLRRVGRSISNDVGYFMNVTITDGSDEDSDIPVDNLGKWLWGLKKYPPHLLIENTGDKVILYYPKNAPKEVEKFLYKLKEKVEKMDV